ncbi:MULTISPECIES: preprotein translocase subunit YajC [Shewanella]|uniref:Sec translocon accessory complex subunit YajC n=1 Tax=Shewanella fidelis TaxID=173509 RepID=A0AAW8NRK5_9GAMM|nr:MULTISPECIES: preprotein translocase subunit YajC [Shewanella]MDR8524358.1 preprotein translocase subunit YajC [Shewanella fidelis]MDW4813433.1 preprotein translocase subunit YajC [Shewanella fidelis]MDW4817644.1 preprotein translocase subunit YajC [Shewanella fidelis]MDW4821711.1 preprotein translocase subunit YajC [Shewanella fidelis]MDW4825876.1 preprotein translocase subunit YajC [Shewanella fidelis]
MFISNAYASGAGAANGAGGTMELIFMLVIFGLIFYFMIFRPQSKRVKEHKNLMSSLSKGDEVLTSGGILGKIAKISDENDYVLLTINETSEITIKKDYIAAVLPKGSIKSL